MNLSDSKPIDRGSGSQLMIVVSGRKGEMPDSFRHQLRVFDLDGNLVWSLSDGRWNKGLSLAGGLISLAPGSYRLRVDAEGAGCYEWFVATCAGWQTQVFQLVEDFPSAGNPVPSPALRSAGVAMVKLETRLKFAADSHELRLAELMKMSLDGEEKVMEDVLIHEMIQSENGNPMFNLYAALALLQQNKRPLAKTLIEQLEKQIPDHPDVLALRSSVFQDEASKGAELTRPPMLRASWDCITKKSKQRPGITQPGSLIDQVSQNMVESRPWLLFVLRAPSTQSEVRPTRKVALTDLQALVAQERKDLVQFSQAAPALPSPLTNAQEALLSSIVTGSQYISGPAFSMTDSAVDMAKTVASLIFSGSPIPSGATATAVVDLYGIFKKFIDERKAQKQKARKHR